MRSPAAHPLRLCAPLCLAPANTGCVEADAIYWKGGRKITATHVETENGQVSYETSAGRFSFPLSIVDRVVHEGSSSIPTPGTPGDRAANLPIAPPNALATPVNDAVASAALQAASTNVEFLSKLES